MAHKVEGESSGHPNNTTGSAAEIDYQSNKKLCEEVMADSKSQSELLRDQVKTYQAMVRQTLGRTEKQARCKNMLEGEVEAKKAQKAEWAMKRNTREEKVQKKKADAKKAPAENIAAEHEKK